MTKAWGLWSSAGMANVLSEEKRQQVLALGRLGWSLRRIEDATGVRRETAKKYLLEAGVATRAPRSRRAPKAAREATTGSATGNYPRELFRVMAEGVLKARGVLASVPE